MKTLTEVLAPHGLTAADELLADIEVPVLCGPQRQGDVGIFPRARLGTAEKATMQPVPAEGVPVVRGEATGNTHILQGDGPISWSPADQRAGGVLLGILDVPAGAVAYLIHTDEHGANAIGPGTYRITGKREKADQIRRVAD